MVIVVHGGTWQSWYGSRLAGSAGTLLGAAVAGAGPGTAAAGVRLRVLRTAAAGGRRCLASAA